MNDSNGFSLFIFGSRICLRRSSVIELLSNSDFGIYISVIFEASLFWPEKIIMSNVSSYLGYSDSKLYSSMFKKSSYDKNCWFWWITMSIKMVFSCWKWLIFINGCWDFEEAYPWKHNINSESSSRTAKSLVSGRVFTIWMRWKLKSSGLLLFWRRCHILSWK